MKKTPKFYWNGKPIEEYTKEQIINIMYDLLQVIRVSISKEARDYIDKLIQKDIDEQHRLL